MAKTKNRPIKKDALTSVRSPVVSVEADSKPTKPTLTDGDYIRDVTKNTYNSIGAIIVQLGLFTFTVSIFYGLFSSPINPRFIAHPIANSLAFIALAEALLLTQPTPRSAQHKTWGAQLHGVLNSASVVLYLIGYGSIYYNKYYNGASHATTWHGYIGTITYNLLAAMLIAGSAIFWFPEEMCGSLARGRALYKWHRLGGYIIVGLTLLTTGLALESTYNVTVLHISPKLVFTAIGFVVVGLAAGIKLSKLGLA
ncbi:hypothetical protein D0Z00_001378 [Geotrichum galactomycetum]|uniref:Uncharacterized protein n=1 Tax=Geotrichum galactomycetum TaxID=27317 RepID=A0ACB6V7A7_9ASCO|nr:hypothetical protein D0Z00_001378 [Geotrichum candidum]